MHLYDIFPHLVAGPIVRAKFFLPQLLKPVALDKSEINEGLLLIIKG
jgi:D-alanyl-lipoteichoic acid acyltransferase DltB (MBOAT superfamily)